MRAREIGVDPQGLTVMRNGIGRLPPGFQQVRQKQVGIGKSGIGAQGGLEFAPGFFEMAGATEKHGVVVPRGGVGGPEPQSDCEMIARVAEAAGSGEKIREISMRIGIVGLNPDGLPESGFGGRRPAAGEPQDSKIVAGLGQIGIERDGPGDGGFGVRASAERAVGEAQLVPRQRPAGRDVGGSLQDFGRFAILPGVAQRGPQLQQSVGKLRITPDGFPV